MEILSKLKATNPAGLEYTIPRTGGVARSQISKNDDVVSVKDFGADSTGTVDSLAAFQAAALVGRAVYIPHGDYLLSGSVNLSIDGQVFYGDGMNATTLKATTANLPIFTFNAGLSGCQILDMKLDRTVAATTGGNGIECSTKSMGQMTLRRLIVQNQNNGLSLGPTDWSEVEKVICQKNYNIGVYVTNTATDGACQWSFDTVLSQMNGAQGFLHQTQTGPGQMTPGTFKSCATFANSGIGAAWVGLPAVPIHDVRIEGGFFGEDGNHVIYLDTYGDSHVITGAFLELAGRRTTGRTLATAASGIGSGFYATVNNNGIQLTGVLSIANSHNGFDSAATVTSYAGCRAANNGQSATAGERVGFKSRGGKTVIAGGVSGNTAGVSQQYGIYTNDGANLQHGLVEFISNSVAKVDAAANLASVNSEARINLGLGPANSLTLTAITTTGSATLGDDVGDTHTISGVVGVNANGVVLSVNSANSNQQKLKWLDANVTRGFLGANATKILQVFDSAAAEKSYITTAGDGYFSGYVQVAPIATPTTPQNGMIWLDSADGKFKKRENGATSDIGAITGTGGYTISTKTAAYSETATTGEIISLLELAAGFTVTLPTAVGNTAKFTFKKMLAAGSMIIDAAGTETIDGGLTATLNNQYESITLVSNNANWVII